MKSIKLLFPGAILLIAALYSGCINEAQVLSGPGLGNNQVRKFVAVGNSLSAGYQSNALYESAQLYSFPNLIATQLKIAGAPLGNFEQPIWGDPGNPGPDGKAARYEILSLTGPVVGPAGLPPGSLKNSTLARAYDNLGIPGAVIYDFLDTTSYAAKAVPPRSNPFFQVVLRNPAFGKRMLDQAKNLKPDLVTFWLGYNDVLGYASSGGVSPSAPTDQGLFQLLYKSSIDSLRAAAPNAAIVVATIPNVTVLPFFTTIGPKIKVSLPPGVKLQYQKKGEFAVSTGSTDFTEANPPLICLTGSSYASLLGRPTGQWYRDKGLQVLPGVDTTKPFGLDPRNPWPNALVLDPDEISPATAAVTNYNNIIKTIAAATPNTAVCDISAFFDRVAKDGYFAIGQKYTMAYISGGIFSLDGVHPSSRGHGIVANEFITTINQRWGMTIPLVNVSVLPGIPAPITKSAGEFPRLSEQAVRDIEWLFRNAY
jgi:lysophospholipase L1-like esterase